MKESIVKQHLIKSLENSVTDFIEEIRPDYKTGNDKMTSYILGTLITAHIIFFNSINFQNSVEFLILKATLIASFLLLVLSLLSFIRYIVRIPKRIKQFKINFIDQATKKLGKFATDFENFLQEFLIPSIIIKHKEKLSSLHDNQSYKDEIFQSVKQFINNNSILAAAMKSVSSEFYNSTKKNIYLLPEKLPKINFYIDDICEKTRYVSFTLGVTFLLVSVILFFLIK